jgi:hypothetical protein
MDWQTPLAIGVVLVATAYVLWRWLKPFFVRPGNCCKPSNDDKLLQIEQ